MLSRLTGPLIFFNIHIGIYLFSQLRPMCPNICFTTSSHVTQLTYVKVLIFFHTNASSEPKEGAKYLFKTFFCRRCCFNSCQNFRELGWGWDCPPVPHLFQRPCFCGLNKTDNSSSRSNELTTVLGLNEEGKN